MMSFYVKSEKSLQCHLSETLQGWDIQWYGTAVIAVMCMAKNTAATEWWSHGQDIASSHQSKRQIVILTNAHLADSTHDLAK